MRMATARPKPICLTIGSGVSMYGAVTLVFNDGLGTSLIGLEQTMPTVSFVPLMILAILFGPSMDYNVFLLSRIREAYQEGDSPRGAVVGARGLG